MMFFRKRQIKTPGPSNEMIRVVCPCSREEGSLSQQNNTESNGELPFPVIDLIREYLPDDDRLNYFKLSSAFAGQRDEDGKLNKRIFNSLTIERQRSIYLRIEAKYFNKRYLFYCPKSISEPSNIATLSSGIKDLLYAENYVSNHFLTPNENSLQSDHAIMKRPSERYQWGYITEIGTPEFNLFSARSLIKFVDPLIQESRRFNRGSVLKSFPYSLFETILRCQFFYLLVVLLPVAYYLKIYASIGAESYNYAAIIYLNSHVWSKFFVDNLFHCNYILKTISQEFAGFMLVAGFDNNTVTEAFARCREMSSTCSMNPKQSTWVNEHIKVSCKYIRTRSDLGQAFFFVVFFGSAMFVFLEFCDIQRESQRLPSWRTRFGTALDKYRQRGETSGDVEYDLSMCTLFFEHIKELAEKVINEDDRKKAEKQDTFVLVR